MTYVRREIPAPGQESVWDYPRAPRVEPATEHVVLTLGGEVVRPQEVGFCGGWMTSRAVGPFKGASGTLGW